MNINDYENWSVCGAEYSTVLAAEGAGMGRGRLYIAGVYEEEDSIGDPVYRLVVKYQCRFQRVPTVVNYGLESLASSHREKYDDLLRQMNNVGYFVSNDEVCVLAADEVEREKSAEIDRLFGIKRARDAAEVMAENGRLTPLVAGAKRDGVLAAIDRVIAANRNCLVMGFDKTSRQVRVGLLSDEGVPCEVAVIALSDEETHLAEGDIICVAGSVKGEIMLDANYAGRSHALMPDELPAA